MKSVFEYSDYREFLTDFYHFKKSTDSKFSHRSFLHKAGMRGPNFLKNVMDGKKNLSPKSVMKFAKALGLSARETKYFDNLVLFNQAKIPVKKKKCFDQLSRFSHRSEIQDIQRGQYRYFSHWYNVAVREYIHCNRFKDDYTALANSIHPKITEKQAKGAVELLKKLKMIEKGKDGYYRLIDPIITTGPEISSIGAHEYHKNMLEIGKRALDKFPRSQRYVRGITGSFSEQTFQEVKMVIDQARKSILELIKADKGRKKVYQIGMQLFPLSLPERGRRK
jgi:uncharacterized protein (TIGR02147 family)